MSLTLARMSYKIRLDSIAMIAGVISPNMVHRRAAQAHEILGPATENNGRRFQKKRALILFLDQEPRLCFLQKMYCPAEIRSVLKREMPGLQECSLDISTTPNEDAVEIRTPLGKAWIAHIMTIPSETSVVWSTTRHSGPSRIAQPQEFFVVAREITPPQFLAAYFAHVMGLKHNKIAYSMHFACGELLAGSARCESHLITFGRMLLSDVSQIGAGKSGAMPFIS